MSEETAANEVGPLDAPLDATRVRQRMHEAVCGMEIAIDIETDAQFYQYPMLGRGCISHSTTDAKRYSTLAPSSCESITVMTNNTGHTYVHLPHMGEHSSLFMARPTYACGHLMPINSVFHGFVYIDQVQVPRIGLYDVSRELGRDVRSSDTLTRHLIVHKHLLLRFGRKASPHEDFVKYHWVGFEGACMDACRRHEAQHFEVRGIVQLPHTLSPHSPHMQRILPPLDVGVWSTSVGV